jgi:ABC-type uncharacterized transport system substrate-binding protein
MIDVAFPQSVLELREARTIAGSFGIEIVPLEIRRAEDITPAFATLSRPADALYAVGSALVDTNRAHIIKLASDADLPTLFATAITFKRGR